MARSFRILTRRYFSSPPPRQVCIVGAGPAGFYTAMNITKHIENVHVDIYEKLPVPFGLIRYGVAPDHPEVKNVINSFSRVALRPNVSYRGNVALGRDVSLRELRQCYNAVVLSYGAEQDKDLGVENEDARNVVSARRFVGWYNGLPQDQDLEVDLSGETVAVLGQGNVAMDVARILLSDIDRLRTTDTSAKALEVLAGSRVRRVALIGRRGPLHAAFTTKELREQLSMPGVQTRWESSHFEGIEEIIESIPRPRKRLTELMLQSVKENKDLIRDPNCRLFLPMFRRSPSRFLTENDKLSGIELTVNNLVGEDPLKQRSAPTDGKEIFECSLALRSIGYRSIKVDDDINFDADRGLIFNDSGRALKGPDNCETDPGLYVAGWLRTGPVGVIINTMSNAFQVASAIKEDFKSESEYSSKPGFSEVSRLLPSRGVTAVDWEGWERINRAEIEAGKPFGKPREKICEINRMLEIAIP